MLKLWKKSNPVLKESIHLKLKQKGLTHLPKSFFSAGGGHGHSGSGSDHEHEHEHDDHGHDDHGHGEHSDASIISANYYEQEARSRIFNRKDTFSVDQLLNQMNAPIIQVQPKADQSQVSVHKSQEDYINFLAQSFERKALEKYPDYKTNLNQYKHLIPNYESLNAYQREAYTLDTYLHWKLEVDELQIREAFNFSGTPVERASQRLDFFKNLVTEDHHHDTNVMHHLRDKLKHILEGEKDYEEFKHSYNEQIEKRLVENIVEKRKKTFYFDIVQNKNEIDRQLFDLNAEGNKHKFVSHAAPHDHIHPQHWLKDVEKVNEEKWKYLAYFDLIIDQHLRQVRPSSISSAEEMFKYVKDEYKPLKNNENHYMDNMYWDYLYTLDHEFYVGLKKEVARVVGLMEKNQEEENPNQPVGKTWKDEHKFPHVADRLGWDFLQELPQDKNPLLERVESHPMYQWQPFVQTPSFEPDKDLCLEEGETIYENKWVFEWVIFWRMLLTLSPLTFFWYIYESYSNNTPASPEYSSRFAPIVHPGNSYIRGQPMRVPETLNYWGSNMWLWQHWVRKGLMYPIGIMLVAMTRRSFVQGKEYVIKAAFNRERDLVFIWKPSGFLYKQLHVYELHYLEQTVPRMSSSWQHLGNFKKDGLFVVTDLRLDQELLFYNEKKYWNVDERDHFFKNTTTYWRGLRHKDVDRGIIINRSNALSHEEVFTMRKINEEVKNAVQKHGPVFITDYEFNYKYQLKKRIQDIKRNLIEGKPVDTSQYREQNAGKSHDAHGDDIVRHAMH